MCNCMSEKTEKLKESKGFEYVIPPIEFISGRAILTFTVKEPVKKRERKLPMLLSKCPFCGEPYEENQMKALD